MEKNMMKEMVTSKYMIIFIIFVLVFTYINSMGINLSNNINNREIVMNK